MEPRREEQKAPPLRREEKLKRFRIVKLEERIAPAKGGHETKNSCAVFCTLSCGGCQSVTV
jgi:hypothetical protein